MSNSVEGKLSRMEYVVEQFRVLLAECMVVENAKSKCKHMVLGAAEHKENEETTYIDLGTTMFMLRPC